jgi:Putative Ig domain
MAMASRPATGGKIEIEAGDDFVVTDPTSISGASFTGLLPSAASLSTIAEVRVEVYRLFPSDSDVSRTSGPPTFSTLLVPTRVNSPSDVVFASRDSADASLSFTPSIINSTFAANNSVLNGIHPKPGQTTGGEGLASGEEVTFNVGLSSPISLPAGHYFFVPQVALSSGDFFWLSAPRPIVAPGTPFPTGWNDLQSWIRNSDLDPDWLRVGTDIVGGATPPTFNASFSLSGVTCQPISVSPPTLPGATVGEPYSAAFTAAGGTAPYRFSGMGVLPGGVSLSSDGKLAGTPAKAGSFPIAVTATDADGCQGSGQVTLAVAAAPPPPPPVISAAHLSHRVFRAAASGPTIARKRRAPIGTIISYRDSEDAITTFKVFRLATGHKHRGRCVAGRRAHQRRCTRRIARGAFTHADVARRIRVRFSGRLGARKLVPGRYLLTLTPKANGQPGHAVTLSFRIVR